MGKRSSLGNGALQLPPPKTQPDHKARDIPSTSGDVKSTVAPKANGHVPGPPAPPIPAPAFPDLMPPTCEVPVPVLPDQKPRLSESCPADVQRMQSSIAKTGFSTCDSRQAASKSRPREKCRDPVFPFGVARTWSRPAAPPTPAPDGPPTLPDLDRIIKAL